MGLPLRDALDTPQEWNSFRGWLLGVWDFAASLPYFEHARGPWAPATVYDSNDYVTHEGVTYVAMSAHVSGGSFDVDAAAGKWLTFNSNAFTALANVAIAKANEAGASAAVATAQAGIGAASNNIYPNPNSGVAVGTGVAVGKYYFVPSTKAIGSFDVWQNVAGVATAAGITLPNIAAVIAAQVTSGDIFPVSTGGGEALNGAVALTVGGKRVGMTAPAGQAAFDAYATANFVLSASAVASLVAAGASIRICAVADTSLTLQSDKPLALSGINVGRSTGGVSNVGTLVRNEPIGSVLYREWVYTPTSVDTSISAVLQWPHSSVARPTEHFFQFHSLSWRLESISATSAVSLSDFMLDRRFEPVTAAATSALAAAKAGLLGSGDLFPASSPTAQALNGASLIITGGRTIGYQGGAGSPGWTTYVTAFVKPASTADLAQLLGSQILIWLEADVSANFFTEKPLSGLAGQARRASGPSADIGQVVSRRQEGLRYFIEILHTVTAEDTEWGCTAQISTLGVSSTSAFSFLVTAAGYSVVSWAKGSPHVTPQDLALQLRVNALVGASVSNAVAAVAEKRFGFISGGPDLVDTSASQYFAGGVQRPAGAGVKVLGWTIPVGATGLSTLMEMKSAMDLADSALLAGRTIRTRYGFRTSPGYARSLRVVAKVYAGTAPARLPAYTTTLNSQVSTSRRVIEITFVLVGDETILAPFVQAQAAASTATEEWLELTDVEIDVSATPSDVFTPLSETQRIAKARTSREAVLTAVAAAAAQAAYSATKVVAPTGGDFLSPKLATAAITDASAIKRYKLALAQAIYAGDANWYTKEHVDVIGTDHRRTQLIFENPDNTDLLVIENTQTVWFNTTGLWQAVAVFIRNGRYPFHSDSSGALKNRVQQLLDCWIEHLGNDGAKAYRASIGTPAGDNGEYGVWASWHAWGCGTSSGMQIIARRTVFKSPRTAFYFHTREYFTEPCYILLEDCACISTVVGTAINIQPLGSMVRDILELRGNLLVGDIGYDPTPWIPTALADQPANHAEVHVVGFGNSPAVFNIVDWGRALKIESADTSSASSVAVSGSAVAAIFGKEVYSKPATGGGLKGYVYGWADIQSTTGVGLGKNNFVTALGKRLGDCTSVNKVLTIVVNGGAPVTITFNVDYTAASNATILGLINGVLGSTATASEYNIGGRYRPSLRDEERFLNNTSEVDIEMGSVLAYERDNRSVRKMTSADPPPLFAGVAWEDIYKKTSGRVKTRGHLPIVDVLRTDAASFVLGDTFSIDPSAPGKVRRGGSQGLLMAIRDNAVRVT